MYIHTAMTIRKLSASRRQPKPLAKEVRPDLRLWQDLVEIGRSVPKEIRAKLPRDLAQNFDHYHDGSPRQD